MYWSSTGSDPPIGATFADAAGRQRDAAATRPPNLNSDIGLGLVLRLAQTQSRYTGRTENTHAVCSFSKPNVSLCSMLEVDNIAHLRGDRRGATIAG